MARHTCLIDGSEDLLVGLGQRLSLEVQADGISIGRATILHQMNFARGLNL